ncbi:MAG: penicillin-binding protein activator [Burkholderiales bacterium]|nr:penicillin-binding protein activator [Burkholderiales bacterium]OJX06247.1 MAG: hypothetical protein BGO72_20870 [Burkholderiales bacterium 70-64]
MSPARRHALRALLAAVPGAVPALSALAQTDTSAPDAEGRGTASAERQVVGNGPIGFALLVPPANGAFRRAAQALIAGVRAAHARDGGSVSLEIIEIDEDPITLLALYDELRSRGFSLVIGPLTRDAVVMVAQAGAPAVFTLALNQPDDVALPPNMIGFGLPIEADARQVASIAWEEATVANASRRPRAAVVQDTTRLGRRSAAAFSARWRELGGDVFDPVDIGTPTLARARAVLPRQSVDVCFVAAGPDAARAVHIALGPDVPVYGTSTLNAGTLQIPGADGSAGQLRTSGLDGVRLVDMPWRVQPDNAAVMAYPKPADMHPELQKLYALGIDAFRLGRQLIVERTQADLDGVTGRLRLSGRGGQATIERSGVLAEYREGLLVPLALQ